MAKPPRVLPAHLYRLAGGLLLLALLLFVLKAAGRLPVSWWVATAPVWGPWGLAVALGALGLAVRLLLQTLRR